MLTLRLFEYFLTEYAMTVYSKAEPENGVVRTNGRGQTLFRAVPFTQGFLLVFGFGGGREEKGRDANGME